MNNFGVLCVAFAVLLASLVNLHQTFQIDDLNNKTKNLEAALKAYNITMIQDEKEIDKSKDSLE